MGGEGIALLKTGFNNLIDDTVYYLDKKIGCGSGRGDEVMYFAGSLVTDAALRFGSRKVSGVDLSEFESALLFLIIDSYGITKQQASASYKNRLLNYRPIIGGIFHGDTQVEAFTSLSMELVEAVTLKRAVPHMLATKFNVLDLVESYERTIQIMQS